MIAVEAAETMVLAMCRRQPVKYTTMRTALGSPDALLDAIDHLLATRKIERIVLGDSTHYRVPGALVRR